MIDRCVFPIAYYGPWTQWSACSRTCGSSTRTRTRSCVHPLGNSIAGDCDRLGQSMESRVCNTQSCPGEYFLILRRKISPNISKSVFRWSINEPNRQKNHLRKLWLSFAKIVTFARQYFTRLHYAPVKLLWPNPTPGNPRGLFLWMSRSSYHFIFTLPCPD